MYVYVVTTFQDLKEKFKISGNHPIAVIPAVWGSFLFTRQCPMSSEQYSWIGSCPVFYMEVNGTAAHDL